MNNIIYKSIIIVVLQLLIGCGGASNSASSDSSEITASSLYLDNTFETTDWTVDTHTKDIEPNYVEVFDDSSVKRIDLVVTSERWQSMLDNMTELYGEFGTNLADNQEVGTPPTDVVPPIEGGVPPIDNGTPPSGPPTGTAVAADTVNTNLVTTTEDPIFVPAEVYYNSKQWYKVGIRFKGNSSLQSSWQSGNLKLSFKLDFDEFEDEYPQIDNQRFYGFKKFSLKNNYNDKSFLREKMASEIFSDAGLAVSHTAFYEVYVDHGAGPEYFGLYTLVEEVDGEVLDTQFTSDNGNLYKPEDEDSSQFIEGSFTESGFEKKTNEAEADWSDIQALFTSLHDTTRTTQAATWRTNLEAVFDVDKFLKYLAVNGMIQNWDTYGLMPHNYYLYNNPENGLLTWIPWDNNEAFQDGKQGGALSLDFTNLTVNQWPLIEKIYADPIYKAKYDEYIQDVIDNSFNSDSIQSKYDTYAAIVEESALKEREGFTFLRDDNDFSTAITELKSHVVSRKTQAQSYLGD